MKSRRLIAIAMAILLCIAPLTVNAGEVNNGSRYTAVTMSGMRAIGDQPTHRGNKYVMYMVDGYIEWHAAQAYCEQQGGHLVTITSAAEQETIVKSFRDYFNEHNCYIGFTDEEQTDDWRWVTGEVSSYRNWASGEPNHYYEGENYGIINSSSGKWNDSLATLGKAFICEFENGSSTEQPTNRPTAQPTEAPPSDDPYEPNDTFAKAYRICAGTFHGFLDAPDDVDYFSFVLSKKASVNISLEPPEGKDFDLYLYNSRRKVVDYSCESESADESIERTLNAGTYYIKVCSDEYDTECAYALKLNISGASATTKPTAKPTVKPTAKPTTKPTAKPTSTPSTGSTAYRALVLGNFRYAKQPLVTPQYDVEAICGILASMNYNGTTFSNNIYYGYNTNESNIKNAISQLAKMADNNDVTFFYYSGRGILQSGKASIVDINNKNITVDSLESWLSKIPGTVVVILDCCNSGGFVNKGSALEDFNPGQFFNSVVDAFSGAGSSSPKSYLTKSKYKVLTSAKKGQSSWGIGIGSEGVYRTLLSLGIEFSVARDEGYMMADANHDGCVSLNELYVCTDFVVDYYRGEYQISEDQNVQVYPANDSFVIFKR